VKASSVRRRWIRGLATLLALCFAVAACSSSGSGGSSSGDGSTASSPSTRTGSGPVNVLYAGSLVTLMEKQISPAFHDATGYTFDGFGAGSSALATQIKGKVRQGDVFISASPSVNDALTGTANGNWVSWYATYSSSPLVLGYNPKSTFADDIKSKPWYDVITESGFTIGRTDPAVDPKGKLTEQALTETAAKAPSLAAVAKSTSNVFPEETLVGRLQSGQLDAGFFYKSEAVAAGIPTVPLDGVDLKATYTITVLNNAPHEAGAEAFVAFLLGPDGQAVLTRDGFDLVSPAAVSGDGVPVALRDVIPTR
jgi:molybdate/tungstate transport system substrate-binding protein